MKRKGFSNESYLKKEFRFTFKSVPGIDQSVVESGCLIDRVPCLLSSISTDRSLRLSIMICLVHEWNIKYENGTNGANLALSSKPRHFDYSSRESTHGSLSGTFLVGFDLLLHLAR